MSLSRSHEENDDERQEQKPTFLTTLQEIMTILEEEVLSKVEENTHLKLVNGLQLLYNLHTITNTGYVTRNFTETLIIANTPTPIRSPCTLLHQTISLALLLLLLLLLILFDEQRNIRCGIHMNEPSRNMMTAVVSGGPIDRILVERSPDHPAKIYDM